MNYLEEHSRRMAMLRAAMPYIAPQNRKAIDMFLQADTLLHTARNQTSDYSLEAAEYTGEAGEDQMGFDWTQPDPESLLVQIQEYCTPREVDVINQAINFMHMTKLYRGYQEFQKMNNHATGELSAAQTGGQNQFFDFLLSRLNPQQKLVFEQLQQIMYNNGWQTSERMNYDSENDVAK